VLDTIHALAKAIHCKGAGSERWRVTGPDLDGDELVVVAVLDNGVAVVTVF
jgi:hypothetical protein